MFTPDTRQYRSFDLVEKKDKTVEGRPVVFNSPTVLWRDEAGNEYKEIIAPGALDSAEMDDVILNLNHEGPAAAKTKNRTLMLNRQADGLYIEADLSKNSVGRDLWESIKNGFYDKMSFAFTLAPGGDEYDPETRTRTIKKIERVWDVAIVDRPAYKDTSLHARSFFEKRSEAEALRERLLMIVKSL
jgi:HK97 family phage prohead protease